MNKSLAAIPERELFRLAYQTGSPLTFKMQFDDLEVCILTFTHRGTASNRMSNVLNGSVLRPSNRVVLLRQNEPWDLDEIRALTTGSIRERLLTDPFGTGTVSLSSQTLYDFKAYQTVGCRTIAWNFQPLEFLDVFEPRFRAHIGEIEELYGPIKETRFYQFVRAKDNRALRQGVPLVSG